MIIERDYLHDTVEVYMTFFAEDISAISILGMADG